MILILIMVDDFDTALTIVKSVYFPMSFANAIGITILILIIQMIFKEKQQISAKQAQIALEIANETLPHFREMDENSLEKICEIIKISINADAVSITDKEYISGCGFIPTISTQLEISKLGELKHMANKAEIRALQAQINPHFLFNALNTIVSFIRINPNHARELIINSSYIFKI